MLVDLQIFPGVLDRIVSDGMRAKADRAADVAEEGAPVRTGHLRSTVGVVQGRDGAWDVVASARYAIYVRGMRAALFAALRQAAQ